MVAERVSGGDGGSADGDDGIAASDAVLCRMDVISAWGYYAPNIDFSCL